MDRAPKLSRRQFIEVGIGALLLPWTPATALAEEDTTKDRTTPSTHLVVVGASEAGFVVTDVGTNPHGPIAGAQVRLTSRFNGAVAQGTTDGEGKVVLDIASLAEDAGKAAVPRRFAFNGSLEVDAAGFRSFATGLVRVEGGRALCVPTQALEEGMPYPRLVTFSNWDALYTANAFLSSAANDATHTVRAELVGVAPGTEVRLTSDDGTTTYATAKATESGENTAAVEFGGTFLRAGSAGALPAGKTFALAWSEDGTTYTATLALTVAPALPGDPSPEPWKEQHLAPFNSTKDFTTITIPSSIPVIGGATFTPWLPQLPVKVAFDPFGYLFITWQDGSTYQYQTDTGEPDANGWKTSPAGTASEQWSKLEQAVTDVDKAYNDAVAREGAIQQVAFSPALTASAGVQLVAGAKWDTKADQLRGELALQASLRLALALSESFVVGPVPVLIQFLFDMRALIGLSCGVVKQGLSNFSDFSTYDFDYSNTGVTITLLLGPSLSVGLGVKGVASVSIKGVIGFTVLMGIAIPHFVFGLSAGVSVDVQLLVFTGSFPLWKFSKPNFYDSWKGDNALDDVGFAALRAYDGSSLGDLLDTLSPVSFASLQKTAEYRRNTTNSSPLPFALGAPRTLANGDETNTGISFFPFVDSADNASAESPILGIPQSEWPSCPSFESTEGAGLLAEVSLPLPAVKGLASESGLVPASDVLMGTNVLSDPRIKYQSIFGVTYVFRLATVMVGNNPRTRVVAQELTQTPARGTQLVFDFPFGNDKWKDPVKHDDYLDYDFDVTVSETDATHCAVHLFVISGKRVAEDDTTMAQAATDQVFSYVRAAVEKGSSSPVVLVATMSAEHMGERGHAFHMYACPRIHLIENPDQKHEVVPNGPDKYAVLSFLDRCADTAQGVLGEEASIALYMLLAGTEGVYSMDPEIIADPFGSKDGSCLELTCDEYTAQQSGGYWRQTGYQVTFRGDERALHYLVDVRLTKVPNNIWFDVDIRACAEMGQRMRLVPWPGHDGMLGSRVDDEGYGRLYRATWGDGATPELALEEIGPENVCVSSFGVDASGEYLYFPSTREGSPGFSYADDGTAAEMPEVAEHRMMACKLHNGRFSDAFVFAEVSHTMDSLVCVGGVTGDEALGIVSTQTTSLTEGRADLWYTSLPRVRAATVLSCECTDALVAPGTEAPFRIVVRNDGNVYLAGFTAQLFEVGGSAVAEAQVSFADDELAPGKEGIYTAELPIPAEWEGERDVTIVAANVIESPSTGMVAQAETLATEYVGTLPNMPRDKVWVQAADEATSAGMGQAPVVALTTSGMGEASTYQTVDATKKTARKSGVPNTADASMSAAALAATGAVLWKTGRSLRQR